MGDLESGIVAGALLGLALGIPLGWLIAQAFMQSSQPKQFSNLEEWEIVKDRDGRVRGVRVHRTAEEG